MSTREKARAQAEGFAGRLKAARRQAGLTQEELSNLADLAPVTLSKLETGVNRPTFEIFIALAHALQTSPNYLTGWGDEAGQDDASAEKRLLINRLILVCEGLPTSWIKQITGIAEKAARP
ncbi:MAG: helix-turn-helix transcriptional regulator [Gemmobacter sp.]